MHTETYENYSVVIDSKGALSPKEEVEAAAICLGLTTFESARRRGVSPETCKCQRANAKSKVAVSNQEQFITMLLVKGWLSTAPNLARAMAFFLCALAALPTARTSFRAPPQGRPTVASVSKIGRIEISGVRA